MRDLQGCLSFFSDLTKFLEAGTLQICLSVTTSVSRRAELQVSAVSPLGAPPLFELTCIRQVRKESEQQTPRSSGVSRN